MLNLAAATLRLFDRYGERKARMKARMKFLIETMGWDSFLAALEEERQRVGSIPLESCLNEFDPQPQSTSQVRRNGLNVLRQETNDPAFKEWARDSVIDHKDPDYRGVHVRIKLGDLTAQRARQLADISRRFSASQLRISVEQNIYLPWVPQEDLVDLYSALCNVSLSEPGVGTVADITTCPGSDTCRLGIASAKGLGSALDEAFSATSIRRLEAGPIKIKISGCPNGCAQHSIANIGFYSAALTHNDRTVPAHFVTIGGQAEGAVAQFGSLLGKFPARNCVKVTQSLLGLFEAEKNPGEDFNGFVARTGVERLKEVLKPLQEVPSFEDDPSFYEDYGHEHERFAVRKGMKGECAGSTVAQKVPTIEIAREWLAQADAYLYHKEYEQAVLAAYEAAAAAARVPLYRRLVDPFNSAEALWEFENLFVLSGETGGLCKDVSSNFDSLKAKALEILCRPDVEDGANATHEILSQARTFLDYCEPLLIAEAVSVA